MTWREEILAGLRVDPHVSVLILGGGVNGTGLLRELAIQGVDCLLVDKSDFVAGASSASSRMIHGGLRYLENREVRLVRESLFERNVLLENAAHYVRPLRTTIPLLSWFGGLGRSALIFMGFSVQPGNRGAVGVKFGLWFYDFVTRKNRRTPTHFLMSKEESLRTIPGLNPNIVATATYWDASITQAERLCVELLQDAQQAHPRCRALNYVRPEGVCGDGVILKDEVSGESVTVRPRVVVNATGAWVDLTNSVLGLDTRFMGGTKGSHLVVDCKPLHAALGDRMIYYQYADGRVCIVFPFMDKVILGSTDVRTDDPDSAGCDEGEVAYMLAALRGVFPQVTISREDIVYTFCGVRPLPASDGEILANVSRSHSVRTIEPGAGRAFPIYCLVGGKWTTFRAFAAQVADQILSRLGLARQGATEHLPIGGGRGFPADAAQRAAWISRVAQASGLPEARLSGLLERYGTDAEAYARAADAEAERPLRTLPAYTVGEIRRIVADEYVVHLADLVYRRSTIALLGDAREDVLRELAEIAARVLGWDPARMECEVARASPPVIRAAGLPVAGMKGRWTMSRST